MRPDPAPHRPPTPRQVVDLHRQHAADHAGLSRTHLTRDTVADVLAASTRHPTPTEDHR